MASMSYDKKNSRWIIQFLSTTGSRKSVSMKATRGKDKGSGKAAALRNHIEELGMAIKTGTSIPPRVVSWAIDLLEKTHSQLVSAGLLKQRIDPELSTLRPFLTKWFADRSGTKHSTEITWRNAERNLIAYFGPDKPLRHITENDAENFERWLKVDQNLSEATRRKRISIAKHMIASAVKARMITVNPFQDMRTASIANTSRQYFVSHEETRKLLDVCSDAEWRALVVLGRYGGLRIPSEIRELKWEDVNWAASCFHVHSSKTEHHEDEGNRVVPLFPEIRSALSGLWDLAEDGAVYVLPRLRFTANVGPTMVRIIKRAGLKVWPKPWHNLRAS